METQQVEEPKKRAVDRIWSALRLRELDPTLTGAELVRKASGFVFRLAEMALVVGLFSFIARQAEHPLATAISFVLNAAFGLYVFSYFEELKIFKLRDGDRKWMAGVFATLEVIILIVLVYGSYIGFSAIVKALEKGVGV
jgi:hypothetical protein